MRRAAVLVFAAVILAVTLPWSFSESLLRELAIVQIETQTGFKAEIAGRATLSLLPRPRVKLEDVTIRDDSGEPVIQARIVRGDLRLISLLAGRLELKSLSLDTPTLSIDLDREPFGGNSALARAARSSTGSAEATEAERSRLPAVTVSAGLVRLHSKVHSFETLVQDVNAVVEWPRIGSPAALNGSAVWRGQPTQFDLTFARPAALLRGEQSAATLHVHGALDADADGSVSSRPRIQFEGSIKASTASVPELACTLGLTLPVLGPLGSAWVDGEANVTGTNISLSNARIGVDGNTFEGSLAIAAGNGRAAISGTLATESLQLDAAAGDMPSVRGSDGQWSREAFDLSGLAKNELDLRISAARLRLGSLQAEDAALSVLLKGGRMELSLAEASAYKGTAKLRAVATISPPRLDLKINGSFSQMDVGALFLSAFDTEWISGTGTGQFALQGVGGTPAEVAAGLDGKAQFTVAQGEINGINIEQALRRLEKRPLLSAADVHNGHTTFDAAAVTVQVAQGAAQISEGNVEGPGAQIAFEGTISIADRTVALKARASQTGEAGGNRAGGPELDFDVSGSWDDLSVEPDAESLIRRSDAAAPLFGVRREGDGSVEPLKSGSTKLAFPQ
ncbi:MAG: AsmA family protein [Methylobacteriaceae bacterium]|nr:AsmA family protein [Methylobacteriaceae bacterium]MBV9246594.1 AsmA family protein [Methylobacteriaceae bacterium]